MQLFERNVWLFNKKYFHFHEVCLFLRDATAIDLGFVFVVDFS